MEVVSGICWSRGLAFVKLFIPTIGTKLVLKKAWTPTIFSESRNWDFLQSEGIIDSELNWWTAYGKDRPMALGEKSFLVTIPKGRILTVDRIYIRRGVSDYDSISFRVRNPAVKKSKSQRFWAKLKDVNGIDVEIVEEPAIDKSLKS